MINTPKKLTQLPFTETVFLCEINNKRIYLKKDYLNDVEIQGNKLRKLKYNLLKAIKNNCAIVSFGGAYSNHISALSAACERYQIACAAIIRGDELKQKKYWNSTLHKAHNKGMAFYFISRNDYREKQHSKLAAQFIAEYELAQNKQVMIIPEGGSNQYAIKGCEEIIEEVIKETNKSTHKAYHHLFCSCGSAGTLAGLINGLYKHHLKHTQITGVSALKGINEYLEQQVNQLACQSAQSAINWQIVENKTQTKYGKINTKIKEFIDEFYHQYQIPLDAIYTAKLVYSVFEMAKNTTSQTENWLIYHSGGLSL